MSTQAKLMVFWTPAPAPDAFEADYATRHLPLAGSVPGLRALHTWTMRSKQYSRVAELVFDDYAALKLALASAEFAAIAADAARLETDHGVESTSHVAVSDDHEGFA